MIKDLKINYKKLKETIQRGTSFALATIGLVSVLGLNSCSKDNDVVDKNTTGYSMIHPKLIKNNEFVILNVGDHNSVGLAALDAKIKYCDDRDIAVGIVVSSDADRENEIYDDVELVKQLISKYTINMPVYLNIDKIIENNNLSIDQKKKLILNFLDKCNSNGIYCGLHGKDSNLVNIKDNFEITGYDACVVMENEDIKYDGTYYVYQDLNGKYNSKTDLENVIGNNGLNSKNRLMADGTVVVGDSNIEDIAKEYDITVKELLKYNGIRKVDKDTILKIPSLIGKRIKQSANKGDGSVLLRGCDISHYQKEHLIDWNVFFSDLDFIILKATDGTNYVDYSFDYRADICNKHGIPIGAYCYNKVRYSIVNNQYRNADGSLDKEAFRNDAIKQVNLFLKQLENKNIEYPCYLDIEATDEWEDTTNYYELYDKECLTLLLDIWKEEIEKAGYVPGIYTNGSGFNFIVDMYDNDKLANDFELWVVNRKADLYGLSFIDSSYVDVPSYGIDKDGAEFNEFFDDIGMWQVSFETKKAGYKDTALDLDYSLIDYSKSTSDIGNDSEELGGIKDILNKRGIKYKIIATAAGVAIVTLGSAIGIKKLKKK